MASKFPTIFPVACHTDNVGPGSTFVAIKGDRHDGVVFIQKALQQGAAKIVVQRNAQLDASCLQSIATAGTILEYVDNTRLALAQLSAAALDYPANKLNIIGVTGTKGKTSSVFLIEHMLCSAGYKTALLSTVANKILDTHFATQLTTQQPDYLHVFFDQCIRAGVEYVIMEVAAQAATLHRIAGLQFCAVLFTNFGQEHGEFYATQEEYFLAKQQIVRATSARCAVVNKDDVYGRRIIQELQTTSFSLLDRQADFYATVLASNPVMLLADNIALQSNLLGAFNAYNVAGAVALCRMLGMTLQQCKQALAQSVHIPGRLQQYVLPHGAKCIIDYAHNPSSFQAVLSTLRTMTEHLIVVFGCGGDRDKTKRPIMGRLAAQYADLVFITSDNPRSEDPQTIAQEILQGIDKQQQTNVRVELDRQQAIRQACRQSKKISIVALLGKGPDHYQIIKQEKFYFNEAEIIAKFFD